MKNQKNNRRQMIRVGKLVGGAVFALAMLLSAPVWAAMLYQDGFEPPTDPTPPPAAHPAGWLVYYTDVNADVLVQAAPSPQLFNGSNALNYNDNSDATVPLALANITAANPQDTVNFSFDFNYTAAAGANVEVSLNGANVFLADGATTGKVYIWDTAVQGLSSGLEFTAGDWYHVMLTLAPVASSTWLATLDLTDASNASVGSINWTYNDTTTVFNQISLNENAGNEMVLNSVFFDNFLVNETIPAIPEPGTVMLFGLGGAILWFWRRCHQALV